MFTSASLRLYDLFVLILLKDGVLLNYSVAIICTNFSSMYTEEIWVIAIFLCTIVLSPFCARSKTFLARFSCTFTNGPSCNLQCLSCFMLLCMQKVVICSVYHVLCLQSQTWMYHSSGKIVSQNTQVSGYLPKGDM